MSKRKARKLLITFEFTKHGLDSYNTMADLVIPISLANPGSEIGIPSIDCW